MRKAVLLPLLFAIIVTPPALWVASGAGGHMSPIMLYPPAFPWWIFSRVSSPEGEVSVLLLGCAINLILLGALGFALDSRSRRR